MRGQKGITLVALIITIVVLLILAVVSITAITEGDVINGAQTAANAYGNQSEQENHVVQSYNEKINAIWQKNPNIVNMY